MKKFLLTLICALLSLAAFAQSGGMKGVVVSRDGRTAIGGAKVTIEGVATEVVTNDDGEFHVEGLAPGQYQLLVTASEFEDLELMVRVKEMVHDMQQVVMVPAAVMEVDDSAFAELDTDVEGIHVDVRDDRHGPSSSIEHSDEIHGKSRP